MIALTRRAPRTVVAVALAAASLAAGAARGQEAPHGAPQGRSVQPGGLAWNGLTFQLSYLSEGAWNALGGDRRLADAAGQLTLGATADLGEIVGLRGGRVQLTVTHRDGRNLNTDSGIDALQEMQEIYGRGDVWRLTQFWYDQGLFGGALDLKVGRMTVSEDFAAFGCEFQNLTFCGSQPGNLNGDYWFNWPVSQWAARMTLNAGSRAYLRAGVYDANPDNVKPSRAFSLDFGGGRNALVPVEIGFAPALGSRKLPGSYKLGGWWSARRGPDVFLDENREPGVLTGAPPLERDQRYGVYVNLQQQVGGRAGGRGVTVFLNATQGDRATSVKDRQIMLGVFWQGFIRGRPKDEISLAIGGTHVNSRVASGEALAGEPEQGTEYVAELDYCFDPNPRLSFRPNLQYIRDPGGFSDRPDALVLGLRAAASF